MRQSIAVLALSTLFSIVPLAAFAQPAHLQGRFAPVRAPEADVRPPSGEARATIDDNNNVRVDMVVSGLTERATSVTLHTGTSGESTGQVARLDVTADGDEARIIGGTASVTPAIAQQIRDGAGYLVLRTNEHPDGFMRAELSVQPRTLGSATSGP
ncbi:CHRD domain-containing protein [Lysobacter sp. HA35]